MILLHKNSNVKVLVGLIVVLVLILFVSNISLLSKVPTKTDANNNHIHSALYHRQLNQKLSMTTTTTAPENSVQHNSPHPQPNIPRTMVQQQPNIPQKGNVLHNKQVPQQDRNNTHPFLAKIEKVQQMEKQLQDSKAELMHVSQGREVCSMPESQLPTDVEIQNRVSAIKDMYKGSSQVNNRLFSYKFDIWSRLLKTPETITVFHFVELPSATSFFLDWYSKKKQENNTDLTILVSNDKLDFIQHLETALRINHIQRLIRGDTNVYIVSKSEFWRADKKTFGTEFIFTESSFMMKRQGNIVVEHKSIPSQLIGRWILNPVNQQQKPINYSSILAVLDYQGYYSTSKLATLLWKTCEGEAVSLQESLATKEDLQEYQQWLMSYHYPTQFVMTSYFSEKEHQAKAKNEANNPSLIEAWIESLEKLQIKGIIFYDRMIHTFIHRYSSENIRFIQHRVGKRSNADDRFFCFYNHLTTLRHELPYSLLPKYALITDLFDVVLHKNPFEFMEQTDAQALTPKLFVGSEYVYCTRMKISNINFYRMVATECNLLKHLPQIVDPQKSFNDGIIGGSFDMLSAVLQRMVLTFEKITPPEKNCNMIVFSYVMNTFFANEYITGGPFHSPFKRFSLDTSYYITHK